MTFAIELNAAADFNDGPVFYTRVPCCRSFHQREKIPDAPGNNSVEHLKVLGGVPAGDILSEVKDGKFVDLKDTDHVQIKGGEVFVSHPPSAGSSK